VKKKVYVEKHTIYTSKQYIKRGNHKSNQGRRSPHRASAHIASCCIIAIYSATRVHYKSQSTYAKTQTSTNAKNVSFSGVTNWPIDGYRCPKQKITDILQRNTSLAVPLFSVVNGALLVQKKIKAKGYMYGLVKLVLGWHKGVSCYSGV